MSSEFAVSDAQRQIVEHAIEHLDHILPGQAPIHDFVHHNTLHGFQHLPFTQALEQFRQLTGIDCYLPESQFRAFYAEGRIDDDDLRAALSQQGFAESEHAWLIAALLADLSPLPEPQMAYQAPETGLWSAVLAALKIDSTLQHPEELTDLNPDYVAQWHDQPSQRSQLKQQALQQRQALFAAVGERWTLRSLLLQLCGDDVLEQVRPLLIRWCAAWLDEGMAAWTPSELNAQGFYACWRRLALLDAQAGLQGVELWQDLIRALPDDPINAIVQQLTAIGVAPERWDAYLQRLALELPGWSGLLNWRQTHPAYPYGKRYASPLADYLALRLVLDRAYAQPICHRHWHVAPRLDRLEAYFQQHWAELAVRLPLLQGQLPEYLTQAARQLLVDHNRQARDWQLLADQVWTWQYSQAASPLTAHQHGWPLYQLCRQLGLTSDQVAALDPPLASWLPRLQDFSISQRQSVWLYAYEHHYRQRLLAAVSANYQRGRWYRREQRPQAQIIFCMDDREEGIRRHLEERNPQIETLGAAGFFGVAMNYQGLDDAGFTPLCPVVVTPSHNVQEHAQAHQQSEALRYQQRRRMSRRLVSAIHHGLRRNPLTAYPMLLFASPIALLGLLAKTLMPRQQNRLLRALKRAFEGSVASELLFNAPQPELTASEQQPRLGYNDAEQVDRVAGLLRNMGLTYGFAEWVVLMGHGSSSQNNPHLSAYDCGACSGRHGGPNARLFAAMVNRPQIRQGLRQRGIDIPDDTWFIGAEHNTADEAITWFDLDRLSEQRLAAFQPIQADLEHAQAYSAHERCRRLASAPRKPKPLAALRHFQARASDFAQARPELGHATNAAALVGRRALSQGAFFDRRLFLISYDPTQDAEGNILEGILLAVGPVGAGINLEYYFSTVNNQRLGCGSKVPHNLTGFFAVMEGTTSDLRTGLPQQMIEIHEAMRLQIMVEAKTEILTRIYQRQPALQELIGGGWVLLTAIDPDDGAIRVFEPEQGFVAWTAPQKPVPMREHSPDCYRGFSGPVDPLLIRQPIAGGGAA